MVVVPPPQSKHAVRSEQPLPGAPAQAQGAWGDLQIHANQAGGLMGGDQVSAKSPPCSQQPCKMYLGTYDWSKVPEAVLVAAWSLCGLP